MDRLFYYGTVWGRPIILLWHGLGGHWGDYENDGHSQTHTNLLTAPLMVRSIGEQIAGHRLTPMLRQFAAAKRACPEEAILLFRMGDFYELFFDDAKIAANVLDLTLTSRDKKSDDPIPMAGVPHHAVGSYIARLIGCGHTVAICDQVEDPKTAKGIVQREVTRIITPGTVLDLDSLDPGAANYIAMVVAMEKESQGLLTVLLDLLAGEVLVAYLMHFQLGDELRRMGVREVLVEPEHHKTVQRCLGESHVPRRQVDGAQGDDTHWQAALKHWFDTTDIKGRVSPKSTPCERRAMVTLLQFAETTQRRSLRYLQMPRAYQPRDYVRLDESTRRNLELTKRLDGNKKGTLLWHLNRCKTAVGARALRHWLQFPLRKQKHITERLDDVAFLKQSRMMRETLRASLEPVRDIERLAGRVALGCATPIDLSALRSSLMAMPAIEKLLRSVSAPMGVRWGEVDLCCDLLTLLQTALVENPPISQALGGIFRRGYRSDLDSVINDATLGHDFLSKFEARERKQTGIAKLKVRYNRVFGYYIEISRAHHASVPAHYLRKQTLVNAERYTTDELKNYETKVLYADERRRILEQELFDALLAEVAQALPLLRRLAQLVAHTDALQSLATVADEYRYTRPEFVDGPMLQLEQGRHPVVERMMPRGERFVPNDVSLDAATRQLLIVTGPNMAGKSTVMRQVALTALMAHMGSFVPADRAQLGGCDRIFTRVGASDNLALGHSTFMVEMLETATILREATSQSLVVLDEIGRGTSTFDGVALAWSVAEFLHDSIGCRALFATHYHELTELAQQKTNIVNVSIAVQEEAGRVVFLRKLIDGPANRSYGIHVAGLAGLPDVVLKRAQALLGGFEAGESVCLVAQRQHENLGKQVVQPHKRPLLDAALDDIDPMNMTPIEAITTLARLKDIAQREDI